MQLYFMPMIDWAMLPGIVPPGSPPVLWAFAALQLPRSRGRIRLRSTNPEQQPAIELNYLSDPEDTRRMVDGMRLMWRIFHDAALAAAWDEPLRCGKQPLEQAAMDSDTALAGLIRNNCETLWHPVGTTRMGPEGDRGAVVDQYCRVRGTEGLRVVDASVMPNIVRANTNLTCIMIGERVADWMRNSD
jgi:choline dehydrogenase